MKFIKYFFFLLLALVFWPSLSLKAASFTPPIKDKNYAGKYYSQSIPDPIKIEAGATKEVVVKMKNTGRTTWATTGNFVSVYTVDPNYRKSIFADSNWLNAGQAAKLVKTTKPGEIGEFRIKLKAPEKVGTYTEKFYLAAENKTWIQGTYFYLKIQVTTKTTGQSTPATNSPGDDNSNSGGNSAIIEEDDAGEQQKEYQADLFVVSAKSIEAAGGSQVNFVALYRNSGTRSWDSYSLAESGSRAVEVEGGVVGQVNISDNSWVNGKEVKRANQIIKPVEGLQLGFVFRMPAKKGKYIARFQLTVNNHTSNNSSLEIPLTVTEDALVGYAAPSFQSNRVLVNEPNIRVGLYKAEKEVLFKSPFVYSVFFGDEQKGTLGAEELARLTYKSGVYNLTSDTLNLDGDKPIRLVPLDTTSYFTLTNYDRKVSWKGNKNFNMYRGTAELKYSPKSNAPFVVNELPLDLYIAGIAETSNGAAMEYIKALLVAARSYAYYHLNNGVPADQRTYDVVATTADQLYLGYNSEVLMPRVVQAQQATYGEMVTYNGNPVITPYFGHSDGRTRTWKEVWGGTDKPWLQPVEAIYDQGESMFGHGVGMSAGDASQRAQKDGWTYDQLLKHYYTGVQVERIY